jgi:predicted alpha/beta-fold hydrolase
MRSTAPPFPDYTPPRLLANGHLQTAYPTIFRRLTPDLFTRERLETDDGDFLDLDWSTTDTSHRLAILSHGLEGHSHRAYIIGMAKALTTAGWDVLAWNQRTCSGEPNRTFRVYHNGATDDLQRVIDHAKRTHRYSEIALVGFSLGGNVTLLHLGRQGTDIDTIVSRAVVFSVPCDLKTSSDKIALLRNRLYMKRFLIDLHRKVRWKMEQFPDRIDDTDYHRIKNFFDFDDRYTAPIHGFKNALDYYEQCSSRPHIPSITVPTLIVNALNDPFLSPQCFPHREANTNPNVTLLTPRSGGHVGFVQFNNENRYWSEQVAIQFLG